MKSDEKTFKINPVQPGTCDNQWNVDDPVYVPDQMGNVPKLRCVTVPRATVVALALAIVVLHWAAPCSAQSRELSRSDIATGRKIIAIEATRILDDSLKRKGLDANSFTETIRFILMADPDLLVLRVAADPAPALGENVFRL